MKNEKREENEEKNVKLKKGERESRGWVARLPDPEGREWGQKICSKKNSRISKRENEWTVKNVKKVKKGLRQKGYGPAQ